MGEAAGIPGAGGPPGAGNPPARPPGRRGQRARRTQDSRDLICPGAAAHVRCDVPWVTGPAARIRPSPSATCAAAPALPTGNGARPASPKPVVLTHGPRRRRPKEKNDDEQRPNDRIRAASRRSGAFSLRAHRQFRTLSRASGASMPACEKRQRKPTTSPDCDVAGWRRKRCEVGYRIGAEVAFQLYAPSRAPIRDRHGPSPKRWPTSYA